MQNIRDNLSPQENETLAEYLRRLRGGQSQAELAERAGCHQQTIGNIESGDSTKLASKTKAGLAKALQIPESYLEAAISGKPVEILNSLKLCLSCWTPGNPPEAYWCDPRAKHCFLCGNELTRNCPRCQASIESYKHKFCPECGGGYKDFAE